MSTGGNVVKTKITVYIDEYKCSAKYWFAIGYIKIIKTFLKLLLFGGKTLYWSLLSVKSNQTNKYDYLNV